MDLGDRVRCSSQLPCGLCMIWMPSDRIENEKKTIGDSSVLDLDAGLGSAIVGLFSLYSSM